MEVDVDPEGVASSIQGLSDLELATLISLIAKEHCLIESDEDLLDDVAQELALVRLLLRSSGKILTTSTRSSPTCSICHMQSCGFLTMSRTSPSSVPFSKRTPAPTLSTSLRLATQASSSVISSMAFQ